MDPLSIIGPLIGLGTSILGGGDDKTGGIQTQEFKPAPRTSEATEIWDAFMGELFGEKISDKQPSTQPSAQPTRIMERPRPTSWHDQWNWAREKYYPEKQEPIPTQVSDTGVERVGPGLRSRLEEQAGWLQPRLEEYKGVLSDLMRGEGVGQGLLYALTRRSYNKK